MLSQFGVVAQDVTEQAALFPEGAGPLIRVGVGTLRGEESMQVVSGRLDRPTVHFEAPPRAPLEPELTAFLDWFNRPPVGLTPLLRAGLAHLLGARCTGSC